MPETYEIEIKSLLGSKENADKLKATIARLNPPAQLISTSNQLNHYFVGGDMLALWDLVGRYVEPEHHNNFKHIVREGKNPSVRTREINGEVRIVIKASVDDTTSSNGTARIEFEQETPDLTLEQLDQLVQDAGFEYQAKWSRAREEYKLPGATLALDKNAGYGYVAEFERVINDPAQADTAKAELRNLMSQLEVEELSQDRLERMFEHYNKNWREYYGTDKIFHIL